MREAKALLCVVLAGCASSSAAPHDPSEMTVVRHVDRVAQPHANVKLAGSRCKAGDGACSCRQPGDDVEKEPPEEGNKRFELRMSADGGSITVASPSFGRFESAGPLEVCFYVDVPAGTRHDLEVMSAATRAGQGVAPRVRLAEYGPKGPWWYDIATVECIGPQGRCNREAVDSWAARTAMQRKRGRLEPCGSAVVTNLKWQTSGGVGDRDGGFYRDLGVTFGFEVKKFPTQFAPGSTECVPK